jgi:hypothetical protein
MTYQRNALFVHVLTCFIFTSISFIGISQHNGPSLKQSDSENNLTNNNLNSKATCGTSAGTVSITVDGTPAVSPVILCQDQCFSITSNNDFILPTPVVGEVSELMYVIYSAMPDTTIAPDLDPNYTGLLWTGQDIVDCNDGASIFFGAGLGHSWIVPITVDDSDENGNPNGLISWDNNFDNCWAYGEIIELVIQDLVTSQSFTECIGFSVSVGSNTYNSTGVYTDVLTSIYGCDSTITTNLTINADDASFNFGTTMLCTNSSNLAPTITGLAGGTFTSVPSGLSINGSTGEIDPSGSTTNEYTVTYTTNGACPNSSSQSITISAPTTSSQTFVECAGFSVMVGASTYNSTGIYTDVLINAAGCDSTVTTDLTINQPTTSSQTFVECAGFSVMVGVNTYNSTGIYTDVLINAAGCDSTVTTDLTIKQPTTSSQTFAECAGFSVMVGANTYDATGVYTDVLTNAAGCDSTVTTDLTVDAPIDVTIDNSSSPTLTANQAGATYQWVDCNNGNMPIALATDQSYTPTANGSYAVEITVGSCISPSSCETITTIGIGENDFINNIRIYPNPTSDITTVYFGNTQNVVNYTLTAVDGRIISQQQNVSAQSINIDLSNESKGVYLLKVDNNSSANVYRIVRK